VPNGDTGFTFDPTLYLEGIIGDIVALFQALVALIVALVQAIAQAINTVFGDVVAVAQYATSSTGIQLDMGRLVWQTALFGAVVDMWKAIKEYFDRHGQWLKDLRKWLHKLHRIQQQMMFRALRQWLNLIQRLRAFLLIFRLLHLKVATKLDNYLARLEARITTAVFQVIRKQNLIEYWLALISDPFSVFKPGHQLASLGGVVAAVKAAIEGVEPHYFFCLVQQGPGGPVPTIPWQQVVDEQATRTGKWGTTVNVWDVHFARTMDLLDQGFSTL